MTDGPARPRRTGTSGDDPPRPAAEILAEATNLRAARLRDALELARVRRLEVEAMEKERDKALRDRDLATATVARLRSRASVRAAIWVLRLVRRLSRRGRPGEPPATRSPVTGARVAGGIRVMPAQGVGPQDYRSRLLARLDGAGQPISVATAGGPGDGPTGEPRTDVLVVTSPTCDPRKVARETILVAALAGDPDAWLAQPWFDAFDVVLVRDDATAGQVSASSSKVAAVAGGDADGWPAAPAVADSVEEWASRTRIAVMVQALRWDLAEASGDYHLARALQRQFERRGHPTSVYFQREWASPATAREDIVLHLWGRYELDVRPTQVNGLWILYHPELVTDELCARYATVFAASDLLARSLSDRTGRPVRSLHQATDPERFRPTPGGPHHELLFVGNSRGTRRTIIDDVTPTSHDLAVYGGGWADDLLDPRYLRGTVVSNRDLPAYYTAADIVLNDHWPESVAAAMINNRLYDALASGAFVISDRIAGLDEEFDGGVVTYADPADLALIVEHYLSDPAARRSLAALGQRAVLERHTIGQRADELLTVLLPLVPAGDRGPGRSAAAEPAAARR